MVDKYWPIYFHDFSMHLLLLDKIKNCLNWFTNQSNWLILNQFEWFLKMISVTELIISIIDLIISWFLN